MAAIVAAVAKAFGVTESCDNLGAHNLGAAS